MMRLVGHLYLESISKKNVYMRKVWIIAAIVVTVILLTILIIRTNRPKEVAKFTFPESIVANNYTDEKMADQIVMVIANKVLNYNVAYINIYYMPPVFNTYDTGICAFIVKNNFAKSSYNIYISKDNIMPLFSLLSHEMAHFDQMEKKELIQPYFNSPFNIYKKDTIYFSKVPYAERLYEIDAYRDAISIESRLLKIFYVN